MEFKKYILKDIATIQTGPFGSRLHKSDYVEDGIPIITVEHLGENKILHNNLPRVNKEDVKRLSKYSLKENDIVFSRVGSVDRRALVSKKEEGWLFSGRCLRVRVTSEMVNPQYLSYYFGLPAFKEYIRNIAVGATMPSINTKILSNIVIDLPGIEEQNRVAELLYALDSKIWINESIISDLEMISNTLFKRWFVDFEFPDLDEKPYKSSGGSMVESALGSIPKGWKVMKVGEVAKIIRGASPRPIQEFLDETGMPWVKISDANASGSMYINSTKEYIIESGISKSRIVTPGTLILSNSATPGIPKFMNIEACVHDGWLIFNDYKLITKEYLFLFLLSERDSILSLSNGSVFRNLKTEILKKYNIVIPDAKTLMFAQEVFETLNGQIKSAVLENITLKDIRNMLLNKLLSGTVKLTNRNEMNSRVSIQ